jgi:hypothetical protein
VTRADLLGLARQSVADPVAAGRRLLALQLPRAALWEALALVACLSVILTELAAFVAPPPAPGLLTLLAANPVLAALVQGLLLVLMVQATWRIGRAFGGRGDLDGSLHVVVWTQTLLVGVQVLQLLALLIAPPFAALAGLAGIVLFFWLFSGFLMALHGFTSRGKVIFGIVASFVACAFAASLVLAVLGVPLVLEGP